MRRFALLTAIVLCGCGGGEDEPAQPPAVKGTPGYPSSMVVIGHSGNTGQATDPDDPEAEVRENAWATGTNPEVRSVYSRILERNPAIEGRAENLAQGGATNAELLGQAEE